MSHRKTIDLISAALQDVPNVQALFLSGSYGCDLADEYSDIDFVLVSDDGPSDAIAAAWKEAVAQTGEIVLWWDRAPNPVLINAITKDWTRTDVVILKPEQMAAHAQSSLKVLFDHQGLYASLKPTAAPPAPNPKKFRHQIEEFIRILGLLPLADGRKEYINGALGAMFMRNILVDMLIEETNAPNRGGMLHLNRLISAEQKDLLTNLPPIVASKEAMIASQMALAEAFLPRARERAEAIGVAWPEAFEAATWAQLDKTMGLKPPYERG